uniref:Cytochrome c oxidase assembly factor 7 n=1 Tax=Rhodnius prolixus TaxID=13249 RepID=R4G3T6_RHOPR
MAYGYDLKSEEDVKEYLKNLGTEYRFGCFKEKPEVCHLLGDYLEAISKDFHKAAKVYKSNCEDFNYSKSCYKIGNYHMAGKGGVVQSQEKSLEYYDKGCDLGDIDSCFRAGVISVLNSKKTKPFSTFSHGVERLRKGCDGKHGDACHHLSALFMDGNNTKTDHLPKDMKKAFEYAVKACDLGNIHACVNVSIMYMRGEGVEKDQGKSDKYKNIALEKKKEAEQQKQLTFQEGLKAV